jgi:hypothetical protein
VAVGVQIAHRQTARRLSGNQVRYQVEGAVAVAVQERHQIRCRVGDRQVGLAIAIEVGGHGCKRLRPDGFVRVRPDLFHFGGTKAEVRGGCGRRKRRCRLWRGTATGNLSADDRRRE